MKNILVPLAVFIVGIISGAALIKYIDVSQKQLAEQILQEQKKLAEQAQEQKQIAEKKAIPNNFRVDQSGKTIPTYNSCVVSEFDSSHGAPGDLLIYLPMQWGNDQLPIIFAARNCDLANNVVYDKGGVTCIKRNNVLAYHIGDDGHFTPQGLKYLDDEVYNYKSDIYSYKDFEIFDASINDIYKDQRLHIRIKIKPESNMWKEDSSFTIKQFKEESVEEFCNQLNLNDEEKEFLAHSYGYTYEFYSIPKDLAEDPKDYKKYNLEVSFNIDKGTCK